MGQKKLTICFLGTTESIHTLKWAQYFADKKHRVHLISYLGQVAKYEIKGIHLHFLNKIFPIRTWPFNTILNLPAALITVKKLIKRIKPDIIHAHYVTSYGSLALLSGFHPLVVTAWGSDILITPKESIVAREVVKRVLKSADLVTCDAYHMKEAIIKLGTMPTKIEIINFGVNTQLFKPGPKNEGFKKRLGLSNHKVVISLRHLDPHYDVESLIRATPFILKILPRTKFIIAGKGKQEYDLKKLAKKLNVENSIKFVGFIPNDELPKYLRLADVYVSTSLSDGGIASSTAEAMACGLPVIVTDVADNSKWVKDDKNGFVIKPKDPKILAEKIIYIFKNKNIAKKLGEEGRKTIQERNDYYKEMEKMEQFYKILISSKL